MNWTTATAVSLLASWLTGRLASPAEPNNFNNYDLETTTLLSMVYIYPGIELNFCEHRQQQQ